MKEPGHQGDHPTPSSAKVSTRDRVETNLFRITTNPMEHRSSREANSSSVSQEIGLAEVYALSWTKTVTRGA
jgi:hypothetical protein